MDTRDPALSARPSSAGTGFSAQIQALRAVAVLMVVSFHFWPAGLRGGYAGVDVFFVISGFLITSHLVREVTATGRIRLLDFWARRVRRLLPAAFVVLLVCVGLTLAFVPAVLWDQQFREIRASALYFENWQLAIDSVDYLNATNAPSLVQHYWSLAVEEQFYIVWPILLLLIVRLARRKSAIVGVLAVVFMGSLAYSIWLTASGNPSAYFSTGTRAWEFAAGGLLSVAPRGLLERRAFFRAVAGWVGFGLIAVTAVLYSTATPFPGFTALLPVVGAVLVIGAGDVSHRFSPKPYVELPVVQGIGAWSYSIYLWHWPLVIVAPFVLGREPGDKIKALLFLATLGIGWASKRFVEDFARRAPRFAPRRAAFAGMLVGALVLSGGTTALAVSQGAATAAEAAKSDRLLATNAACIGAGAIINKCSRPYAVTATVQPTVAASDVPWNVGVAASTPCPGLAIDAPATAHACTFGVTRGQQRTIALVGDSHADQLIDPIVLYGLKHGWKVVTYTREGCSGIIGDGSADALCRAWTRNVQTVLKRRSDIQVVLYSNYTRIHRFTAAAAAQQWKSLIASGKMVIPVRDIPAMPLGKSAPTCVAANMNTYDPCPNALPKTDIMTAAARRAKLPLIDLSPIFCPDGRCHTVIGGVIVYVDDDHMTYHFTASLAPVLGADVAAAMKMSK